MKEEEAKTKWCPMVQVIVAPNDSTWQNHALTNRLDMVLDGGHEQQCLASGCMMWRWIEKYDGLSHGGKQVNYRHEGGYCGLGGKE